jgi:hypothetical protein
MAGTRRKRGAIFFVAMPASRLFSDSSYLGGSAGPVHSCLIGPFASYIRLAGPDKLLERSDVDQLIS